MADMMVMEREDLLQNLSYVQQMLYKMVDLYSRYVQLERNFRANQEGIKTSGVQNKAKLAFTAAMVTYCAFYIVVSLLARSYFALVISAAFAYWLYKRRKKESKSRLFLAFVVFSFFYMINAIIKNGSMENALVLIVVMAAVIAGEWYFITQKNKKVAEYNLQAEENNRNVQGQRVSLYRQYEAMQVEILNFGNGWYPPDYYNKEAVDFFVRAVKNFRANTIQEMVNLFEQSTYHKEMLDYQQHQTEQLDQLVSGQQELIKGQEEIKGSLRLANMINMATMFNTASIANSTANMSAQLSGISGQLSSTNEKLDTANSLANSIRNKMW